MNTTISQNFRKYTKSTITSIILFILVYILLFILAVGITIALGGLGLFIITENPMIWTLLIGGGLIISGLTILFFLIKFIFSSNKMDRSHLTEIKKSDHPQIFSLLEEIVKEVDTTFPKKVYLSNEVNASVFYDSNFWSMFLPVKKNLIIGVGLMNAVTQQEFKAILAHEFGHFSQKSMKVGSYVYQVNQVIYNMLYNNNSFDNIISKAASVHSIIAICIAGSIWVIKQIQTILQKMYEYININYMSLSREMEFHADEVAANVAGSDYLSSSLLRLDLANHALDSTFTFYDEKIKENIVSENIYAEQSFIMNFLATKNRYELVHDLPKIDTEQLNKYNKSKLNIKNQWASHPNTEDRIEALNRLNITVPNPNNAPAIDLLDNKEKWLKLMTDKIFNPISYTDKTQPLAIQIFKDDFSTRYEKDNFDVIFNNYYAQNNPIVTDFDNNSEATSANGLESLFADEYVNLVSEYNGLNMDLNTLKAIESGDIDIKSFDYDGVRYNRNEASKLIQDIGMELENKKNEVENHNKTIYRKFLASAKEMQLDTELKNAYVALKLEDDNYAKNIELYQTLNDKTQFIFMTTPFEDIEIGLIELTPHEKELKKVLSTYLEQKPLLEEVDSEIIEKLEYYVQNELKYFHVDRYDDNMLNYLFTAINYYYYFITFSYFLKKKLILNLKKQIMLAND